MGREGGGGRPEEPAYSMVYIQTSIHTSEGGPLQMLLTLTLNFLPVCPKNSAAARPTTVYK